MNTTDPFVISTNGLTKTDKRVNALWDRTLQVPRGSICGFPGSTATTGHHHHAAVPPHVPKMLTLS